MNLYAAFPSSVSRIGCGLVAWATVVSAALAETPRYFVQRDTWAETMVATRAAYAERPQEEPLTLGFFVRLDLRHRVRPAIAPLDGLLKQNMQNGPNPIGHLLAPGLADSSV